MYYWRDMAGRAWEAEVADQEKTLAVLANVFPFDVRGMKAPLLQSGGDVQFAMMENRLLSYDMSLPSMQVAPPLWPYTLDYRSGQECSIPPCPTGSHPGLWEVPLVDWIDTNDTLCNNVDACYFPADKEEALTLLRSNFQRHYNSNRAPLPLVLRP
ncbi:PREDICTED: uncharacterized protein LOC106820165, partial [Priapulus caudatus]|uniref:Uncharacterized protein LOC106820165 n=1 Tax=Priapulus caudatus TaxID=37621 RepID=A0ABM1F6X3_PRICU